MHRLHRGGLVRFIAIACALVAFTFGTRVDAQTAPVTTTAPPAQPQAPASDAAQPMVIEAPPPPPLPPPPPPAAQPSLAPVTVRVAPPYAGQYAAPPPWIRYAATLYTGRPALYVGGPIPPTTRLEERPFTPLVVAGAVAFAAGYAFSLIDLLTLALATSGSQPYGFWALPVVGPLVYVGVVPSPAITVFEASLVSIVQVVGIGLFVGGLASRRRYVVPGPAAPARTDARSQRVRWSIAPQFYPGGAGVAWELVHF